MRQPLVNGAIEPARLYIKMELQRALPLSVVAQREINDSLLSLDKPDESERTWRMLAALGGSMRLNWVPYFLSNDSYTWVLEEVSIDDFILTGMNPEINRYIVQAAGQSPAKLYEIWQSDPVARKVLEQGKVRSTLEPGYLPILACEPKDASPDRPKRLHLFDGMHRLLSAIISGETTIKAWVGRITNPAGAPFLSPEIPYSLITIHLMAADQGPEFDVALREMARVMIETFPNTRDVLRWQLDGTKVDSPIRAVLDEIVDTAP